MWLLEAAMGVRVLRDEYEGGGWVRRTCRVAVDLDAFVEVGGAYERQLAEGRVRLEFVPPRGARVEIPRGCEVAARRGGVDVGVWAGSVRCAFADGVMVC
jgi:hypothetical protein